MKRITLAVAAMLVAGSAGVAFATPTLYNGDFSSTNPNQTNPTEFSDESGSCSASTLTGRSWGTNFLQDGSGNGWTAYQPPGGTDYAIWYPSATAASGTSACTRFDGGQSGDGSSQRLPSLVTAPFVSPGPVAFVGLDGQHLIQGGVQQTLDGLVAGDQYTLSFLWATTQELSRNGSTWDYLQVNFGGDTDSTSTNEIEEHGFSGWASWSKTFTASSTSELLSIISFGGQLQCDGNYFAGAPSECGGTLSQLSWTESSGLPPFALLANVSLTHNVPEPPELAMFGLGLLGLGVLTVFARNRALRRKDEDGEGGIA